MIFKVAVGSKRSKDAQYGPYPLVPGGLGACSWAGPQARRFTASARTEFRSTNYELGGDGEVLTKGGAGDVAGGTGKAVTSKGASQRSASVSDVEVEDVGPGAG
jgi:hypothetical protein